MKFRFAVSVLACLAFLVPGRAMAASDSGPETAASAQSTFDPCAQALIDFENEVRSQLRPGHAGSGRGSPINTRKYHRWLAYATAVDYITTFFPRWLTYYQSSIAPCNTLVGPDRISPVYQAVVAINDDTLYASSVVNVSDEPVIVTIPPATSVYSILHLDGYGNVFPGIPGGQPGVYGLTGRNWSGTLPAGITPVALPYDVSELIFRADKYSPSGQDWQQEAAQFRANLRIATLSDYLTDPMTGPTKILPEWVFGVPFKTIADRMIKNRPIAFLKSLQTAVLSGSTQPLTPAQQALSDRMNRLIAQPRRYLRLAGGIRAGHGAIIHNYLTGKIPGTHWISFPNIGEWNDTFQGNQDRSSIAEFILYGNNRSAAVYYHTFKDRRGQPLNGAASRYVLRFEKDELPDVTRFWSVTAYLPESIELVPNKADTYVIASYTPGLVTATDGSVTLILSAKRPEDMPTANWLPVPRRGFNIMLRAYGPAGPITDGSYIPPEIERQRSKMN